jgi:hypothetical protein
MTNPFWVNVYIGSVLITWLGATLFTLGYGLLMRWYRTEEGVHLFVYGFAVTFCMFVFAQRVLYGVPILMVTFAQLIGVPMLGAAVWWRFVLFVRSYWRNRPTNRALGLTQNGGQTR